MQCIWDKAFDRTLRVHEALILHGAQALLQRRDGAMVEGARLVRPQVINGGPRTCQIGIGHIRVVGES
jgi:hypothetical protein